MDAGTPGHDGASVGDVARLRRNRRTFRYCVSACVFFCLSLWFAEGYLRFDRSETQYRMALSHARESARPILRNAVKRDALVNDPPTARYLEALADVEESDLALPAYEQALRLDPRNAFLLVKYGCALLDAGRPVDARERFRAAALHPPRNALPRYLEAAALHASLGPEDDLGEVMALLVRANSAGDPVLFPEPLWHATLPERGAWHAEWERELAARCLAPLRRMTGGILSRAERDIAGNDFRDWDAWLREIAATGAMIAGNPEADGQRLRADRALEGLRMETEALRLRRRIVEARGDAAAAASLDALDALLARARDGLADFENRRGEVLKAHAERLQAPLAAAGKTLALLAALYLLLCAAGIAFGAAASDAKNIPSPLRASAMHGGVAAVWFAALALFSGGAPLESPAWMGGTAAALWDAASVAALALTPVAAWMQWRNASGDFRRRHAAAAGARRWRAGTALAIGLFRRNIGAFLGLCLCAVCLWAVSHRLVAGLYPYQIPLLTTGLESEETEWVRQTLLSVLSP